MNKKWEKIADNKVHHLWACGNPMCNEPGHCEIPPTEYQNSGVPICGECGEEMVYLRTEILV